MRLRHIELLIMLLIVVVCGAACIFTYAIQQREIEHLNRNLMDSRQEIARKTNLLFEANRELDVLKTEE